MITENAELMRMARESLKGKWGTAIAAYIIYVVVCGATGVIPIVGIIASFLIAGPMELGLVMFYIALSRNEKVDIELIFKGFNNFATALTAYLLVALFTILWLLLLIVPGIIASYSYAMTFYIITDDKEIRAGDAIKKSKQMMNGYKAKLFYLHLRFFGWFMVSCFTLGVGFFWLGPYVKASTAKFYDDIKSNPFVMEIM